MMWSLRPASKVEEYLKQYFLFVRIKSLQVPFPLKQVFDLIMSNRFKDCINDINIGLFGSILKSPRITCCHKCLNNDQQL